MTKHDGINALQRAASKIKVQDWEGAIEWLKHPGFTDTQAHPHVKSALEAAKEERGARALDWIGIASRCLQENWLTQPKTELLCTAGIHLISRITDDGDDTEPDKLCDESMIQILDDAGQELVLLASELDLIANSWIEFRKIKPC